MRMTTDPSAAVSENICRSCGMCCDGTLFDVGRIEAVDDLAALTAAGLSVRERRGIPVFEQPCECFRGDACGIYPVRPVRCQQFRCRVLEDLADGRLSIEEAHNRVSGALKWRRALVEHLGERFGGSARSLVARWRVFKSGPPDQDTELVFGGFLALINRQFRPPRDGLN